MRDCLPPEYGFFWVVFFGAGVGIGFSAAGAAAVEGAATFSAGVLSPSAGALVVGLLSDSQPFFRSSEG